jgi:hypothetical protein
MTDTYEIRKDIPVASSGKQMGLTKTLRKMECMDSIVIPGNKISSVHACAAQAGMKVKTQKNADGTITVWRVDPLIAIDQSITKAADADPGPAAPNSSKSGPVGGYYAEPTPYGPSVFVVTEVDEFGRPVVPGYALPPASGSVSISKHAPTPAPAPTSKLDIFS